MESQDATTQSVFFAYAGQPALRAESIRDAVDACQARGLQANGWEQLKVAGKILIGEITNKIDECDACVAEVSSSNPNVLFEAGYALARGKVLLLAIDETDGDSAKNWKSLALMDTIGRLNYSGNSQILANGVFDSLSERQTPLMETLLAGARPRESNAVFAPGVPHKFNAAERLERLLDRKTHLNMLASQEEFGLGPLAYYVELIYRSSAGIFHFMKPSRVRAQEYNSRLALLAGIMHGLEIPLLMVAEQGYEAPLDYKDMLYTYQTAASLTECVNKWLEHIPTAPQSNKRLGRLKLDIELPLRTFGQYVAESEKEELTDYFVHTNEFEAVLSGRAAVFTGRKGTGKTATMQQAVVELGTDRRNLVVPIKPSSYDLANLVSVIGRFDDPSMREYFLLNLWCYLLTSEISLRALSHAATLPAGVGADANTEALDEKIDSLKIDMESDLSSRLDDAISDISSSLQQDGVGYREAAEGLRIKWRDQLLPKLKSVLHGYDRVAVVMDNLDKTWERGVDYDVLSQFILSLLVASGKLQTEFEKTHRGAPSANVTLTVFLRTDIYDVMKTHAREPDKINPQLIQWRDEELLIRVLEERYLANRSSNSLVTVDSLWSDVFCAEVNSLPTRDYLLWRALPRPRDVIFLGNAALTTAINRRHDRVYAQDFTHAESLYSRFAVEALLVESEAQGFDLEEILFEFAGFDSTVEDTEMREVLADRSDADNLISWLVRTSFLGIETRDSSFVYVEGDAEARKKRKAADRLALRLDRPLRYRIHPAFRPYLDIRDDDLHLKDATTTLP